MNFIHEHAVHVRNNLHWHVDEALREYEANVVLRRKTSGPEKALQRGMERRVKRGLVERIVSERLDGSIVLEKRVRYMELCST